MPTHCPICKEALREQATALDSGEGFQVPCRRCGRFRVTGSAVEVLLHHWSGDRAQLSGVCRYESERGNVLLLRTDNIDEIVSQAPVPKTVTQAVDNFVLYIGDNTKKLLEGVRLSDPPITVTTDPQDFLAIQGMLAKLGYIISTSPSVTLTVEGWRRYEELRTTHPDSRRAFVAMWFDESLNAAWTEGIRPGLEDAGYTAVRPDALEHNEKIDDRIIAEIRRSGLIVADLTGGRPNVYFEAGFALGLGIPVIWTCHKDGVRDLHFDIRQHNYIVWKTPEELRERLRLRIEANYPRKA